MRSDTVRVSHDQFGKDRITVLEVVPSGPREDIHGQALSISLNVRPINFLADVGPVGASDEALAGLDQLHHACEHRNAGNPKSVACRYSAACRDGNKSTPKPMPLFTSALQTHHEALAVVGAPRARFDIENSGGRQKFISKVLAMSQG
jgi:hypothetical protein